MDTAKATFADKAHLIGRVAQVGIGVFKDRAAPACAIRAGAKLLDVKLTGGDAGSSTRQGLELTVNDEARQAGIPTRLFTKSTPTFVQRMFLGLSDASVGGIGFYMQVRPQLDIEAPRGYYACMDYSSWRSMTLMDDIATSKGAKFISTETYIDKSMMADLLGNMAKWHATLWDSPKLKKELAWVRTTAQFLGDMNKYISFKGRSLLAMEKYPHLLPNDLHGQGNALWNATLASYQIDLRQPATFLHGDAHIGQSYITREGRMGYSDWQLVQRGSWAADFAYGLTSALTIEDSRNWESGPAARLSRRIALRRRSQARIRCGLAQLPAAHAVSLLCLGLHPRRRQRCIAGNAKGLRLQRHRDPHGPRDQRP
jgi:hypothetical protein